MESENAIGPFEYFSVAGRITFGRGAVDRIESMLADTGAERALVVCGEHVGANEGTIHPVEAGLGDALVGKFDGTTPEKRAREAFRGRETVEKTDADALVAVGGGSSIDVARAIRAIYDQGSYEECRKHATETDTLPVSEEPLPLLCVPTTLAGADLSTGGSVTFYEKRDGNESAADGTEGDEAEPVSAGYGDPTLMPDGLIYDPDLFETVPESVLVGSAMNGFDKGIELPYSRHANPLTDAPALRGLSLLASSLPQLDESDEDSTVMDRAVAGVICVQYGRATTGEGLLSVIHAFGHGLRAEGVQQGVAHAVIALPVLEYLFSETEGRRDLLAEALGVDAETPEERAAGVVNAVREVRDGMGLPSRLRDIEGLEREALSRVAAVVCDDSFLANGPEGLDPDRTEIERVLDAAW